MKRVKAREDQNTKRRELLLDQDHRCIHFQSFSDLAHPLGSDVNIHQAEVRSGKKGMRDERRSQSY
jgi:hypothetical protein